MKRNSAKTVVALMLVMAMMSAMFCAAAEDTGLVLVADEAARSTVKGLTVEGEAAVPSEVEVLIGEPSPDGVEDAPMGNESNAGDFEIRNGVLVKYVGKGGFTGKAEVTFRIDPKKVSGLKLKAGEGVIDASWKKAPGGVTGYQLEYGLKKDFSDAETVTVKKGNIVKRTLSGLESGKTYYVRIRAYKKVDKTTFYSVWSSAKQAKVK